MADAPYVLLGEKLDAYLNEHCSAEDPLLQELQRQTYLKTMHPRMISGSMQGTLLTMLSEMLQPDLIIEVGTFTGYSAICLARGLKQNGMLHTIEINDELRPFALEFFKKAGLKDKITAHTGNALHIIPTLPDSIDLVFLDADKSEYLAYYQAILPKVKKGGIILADNVLWNGKVVEEIKSNDKFTLGIKEFNSFIKNDSRVQNVILPLRDGIMFIRKVSD